MGRSSTKPQRPRVLVTPSPDSWALLEEVHQLTGTPKAALISEMLDTVAPVFREQLEAHRRLVDAPDKARELIAETGWKAVHSIAQAQLDLPPARKTRRPRARAAK